MLKRDALLPVGLRGPVFSVTQNGHGGMRQLRANLVIAPCLQKNVKERGADLAVFNHTPRQRCFARLRRSSRNYASAMGVMEQPIP